MDLITGKSIENDGKTFKAKDSGSESPIKGPVKKEWMEMDKKYLNGRMGYMKMNPKNDMD